MSGQAWRYALLGAAIAWSVIAAIAWTVWQVGT